MKTATKSVVVHTTSIMADKKTSDGGRSLLIEAFDFIHGENQVGELVVHFGTGGCISSLQFKESETIPQKEIEVEETFPTPIKHYN